LARHSRDSTFSRVNFLQNLFAQSKEKGTRIEDARAKNDRPRRGEERRKKKSCPFLPSLISLLSLSVSHTPRKLYNFAFSGGGVRGFPVFPARKHVITTTREVQEEEEEEEEKTS
jgi:hypothetical protein